MRTTRRENVFKLLPLGALMAMLLFATSASATTVELTKYDGVYPAASFDGSDAVGAGGSPAFGFSLENIDIDQTSNLVYTVANGYVYKFNFAGASQAFSGLGTNTVFAQNVGSYGDVEVDNSPTGTQGRIYAFAENGGVKGWQPSGEPLGAPYPSSGITGFNDNCGAAIGPNGNIWVGDYPAKLKEFTPAGVSTGTVLTLNPGPGVGIGLCDFDMDTAGNFYVPLNYGGGPVYKFSPTGVSMGQLDPGPSRAVAVDPSNNEVYVDDMTKVNHYSAAGNLLDTFGEAEGPPSEYPGLQSSRGIAIDGDTHIVYVANKKNPNRVDRFKPTGPITIPTVTTTTPDVEPTSAVLRGVVNGDGVDTTDCQFEWGPTANYNHKEECAEGKVFSGGSGDHNVSAPIINLTKGTTYHFRITAKNSNNVISKGSDYEFTASGKPVVTNEGVSKINTDGVQFNITVDPNGGTTTYHVDWGTEAGVYGNTFPEPDGQLETVLEPESFSQLISGLTADTEYHYQVTAENDAGSYVGPDRTFKTFPPPPPNDPCGNALVRKQTGAALLLDCRAYELVSAADQGGYDVESDLLAGQTPLTASPRAQGKVLYSLHFGALPAAEEPTNFGHDPYVATRGSDGWTSAYVGLPAAGLPSDGPYGSPLDGTDAGLTAFSFGGSGICNPCFGDDSINIPLRLPDGSLVKGMDSKEPPAGPADPAGQVEKPFSDDGSHFVFGSDKRFQEAGNEGSVSIYDRNLNTGAVLVASTLPTGATMSGSGIAELDISSNGSRILVGKLVGTDPKGNQYFDLYMHIGSDPKSVLVADTASGVIYDGMTSDGSKVFFTTPDKLTGDNDTSPDLYRADVGTATSTIARVSTGIEGTGDTDECTPVTNWNVASGGPNCGTVAIAGGGGVAAGDGTVYFTSPEKLDGPLKGTQDQPNLYIARPGEAPHFVATIDSSLTKPGPQPPQHPVANNNFAQAFEEPSGLTVDQSNGDVYIPELGTGVVHRFKPDGTADNFTTGPDAGTNTLTGFEWNFGPSTAQVAVDNSSGPAQGDIYVVDGSGPFNSTVEVFSSTGTHLSTLDGTETESPFGEFALACGVAVDQANGNVYVGDYAGDVWRYTPAGSTPAEADYSGAVEGAAFDGSCNVAVGGGKVFLAHVEGAKELTRYLTSDFALGPPPKPTPTAVTAGITGIAIDPATNDLYADQGNKIAVFNAAEATQPSVGSGSLTASVGVSVNSQSHHVYATSNGASVVDFGYFVPPYVPIDNPAVQHGVDQAATHSFGDFQVTPSGDFAAFNSTQSLAGAVTHGHSAIYRYDATGEGELECVSCGPSGTGDASLTPTGLNLTDDGRVFFTSQEQFVLRDTNEKKDAYEWEDGNTQIISSGTSPSDSGLLSVSADGVDAFFFTRDTLTPFDTNGSPMKIYDARELGGFLYNAPPFPCAASDECHGPGTQAAPPPNINTIEGSGRKTQTQTPARVQCRRGFVKRHGKCVRKRRHHRKHTRSHR
jgi:sugar lactone lactonase YvrE